MSIMTLSSIGRCDARIEALRADLGGILSARILEAEALDFLWEARIRERYLGQEFRFDEHESERYEELSRVAFISLLEGRCLAGCALIDGDGEALQLLWERSFDSVEEAERALVRSS